MMCCNHNANNTSTHGSPLCGVYVLVLEDQDALMQHQPIIVDMLLEHERTFLFSTSSVYITIA
jgi:hypothetical protein